MSNNSELIEAFHEEAVGFIEPLKLEYEKLKKNPNDIEAAKKCYIAIHTIKGNARFMKLPKIVSINTPTEEILDRIREGKLVSNDSIIETLFKSLDATAELLDSLIKTNSEGDGDYSNLVAEIESHLN